ncbi:hypothetical protein BC936DRAFT_139718 [Jimgerdemannia flammicorona]|uniref:Uncharacterized protein n=1 Tax=Jimgerdemannia flammicorona TaxID=994334 RepID=A0A433DHG6_9FUNG|nr:hypothetical protein BC936DRAFT_139718 [Jimgerdemannia flammicorona]
MVETSVVSWIAWHSSGYVSIGSSDSEELLEHTQSYLQPILQLLSRAEFKGENLLRSQAPTRQFHHPTRRHRHSFAPGHGLFVSQRDLHYHQLPDSSLHLSARFARLCHTVVIHVLGERMKSNEKYEKILGEDLLGRQKKFVKVGLGATVLIHEASLENDVTQETLEKRRCTVREAAEVGMR